MSTGVFYDCPSQLLKSSLNSCEGARLGLICQSSCLNASLVRIQQHWVYRCLKKGFSLNHIFLITLRKRERVKTERHTQRMKNWEKDDRVSENKK